MGLLDTLQVPTSKLDFFIRSVEISSYIAGRIRLHSKNLVGNPALEQEIQSQLGGLREIDQVETSTVTGSILIRYTPEVLRTNNELKKVEEYIMTHVRRK